MTSNFLFEKVEEIKSNFSEELERTIIVQLSKIAVDFNEDGEMELNQGVKLRLKKLEEKEMETLSKILGLTKDQKNDLKDMGKQGSFATQILEKLEDDIKNI